MLKRVSHMMVFVSDMDRAAEFNGKTLGIGVANRSQDFPQYVELASEGAILALNQPSDQWTEGKRLIGRNMGITMTVPDIQSIYRSLAAKGVRFAQPPAKQPWSGTMAILLDPDGNEIALLGEA
jgi:predicted enzyme related to lactoylglutathione lyase